MTREEAIERLKQGEPFSELYDEKWETALDMAIEALKEQKIGHWIVTSKFDDCTYAKCDQCNTTQVFYNNKALTNFCPECGSRNRGEEDGSD